MPDNLSSYFYVFLTIAFTVYNQIVSKWQVTAAGTFPTNTIDKLWFLFRLLLNPWIVSTFAGVFLAGLAWMAAMTQLPLSNAYPIFVSFTFVFVVLLSSFFLRRHSRYPR